jgi:putative endonuclease
MAPSLSRGTCDVYFLRLRFGMLYVGASVDLEQHLGAHVSGQACRTIASIFLRITESRDLFDFSEARQREAQLKRWSRQKKEALVRGDIDRLRKLSQSGDQSAGDAPGVLANC